MVAITYRCARMHKQLSWLLFYSSVCCGRSVRPVSSLVRAKLFHCSVVSERKQARVSVPGAYTPPDPEERLKQLKSGEKT